MKQVDISICRADDGIYSAYCNDHPAFFGMGNTPGAVRNELEETLRCVKEDGADAFIRPDWLDGAVKCVSVNPEFPPFDVSFTDIFGVYCVLMCMSLK